MHCVRSLLPFQKSEIVIGAFFFHFNVVTGAVDVSKKARKNLALVVLLVNYHLRKVATDAWWCVSVGFQSMDFQMFHHKIS